MAETRKKFVEWAELLEHAQFEDGAVYRWWLVQMLLQIHGDLDSIAFCVREVMNDRKAAKAATTGNTGTSTADRARNPGNSRAAGGASTSR